jgi:hypothetical protein
VWAMDGAGGSLSVARGRAASRAAALRNEVVPPLALNQVRLLLLLGLLHPHTMEGCYLHCLAAASAAANMVVVAAGVVAVISRTVV